MTFSLAAAPASAGQRVADPASRLSLEVPAGWASQPGNGEGPAITFVSDARLFAGDEALAEAAMGMVFVGKAAQLGASDPVLLAETFAGQMAKDAQVESQTVAEPVLFGGGSGAWKTLKGSLGGQTGHFSFATLIVGDDAVLMMGVDTTGDGRHVAAFRAAAATLCFGDCAPTVPVETVPVEVLPPPAKPAADSEVETPLADDDTGRRMLSFLASWNNDYASSAASFRGFAAADVEDPNTFSAYSLVEPEVLKTTERDGRRCYEVKAKSGIGFRLWSICWRGGKIASIVQTGSGPLPLGGG